MSDDSAFEQVVRRLGIRIGSWELSVTKYNELSVQEAVSMLNDAEYDSGRIEASVPQGSDDQ